VAVQVQAALEERLLLQPQMAAMLERRLPPPMAKLLFSLTALVHSNRRLGPLLPWWEPLGFLLWWCKHVWARLFAVKAKIWMDIYDIRYKTHCTGSLRTASVLIFFYIPPGQNYSNLTGLVLCFPFPNPMRKSWSFQKLDFATSPHSCQKPTLCFLVQLSAHAMKPLEARLLKYPSLY
jgi:hypothetical protein